MNAIRDAASLSRLLLDDDHEGFDVLLEGWHGQDTTPLIVQLAGFVGAYANDGGHGRERLEAVALLAAADPRCAA